MTKIEWVRNPDGSEGKTWNPIVGCSIVSPGCTNCYAMKMAARIERMSPQLAHYRGLTQPSKAGSVWTGKVAIAPEKTLLEPLRRRKPTMWFVNSMSDLFHESVSDTWIDRVFAVMALCPQHTFQVLTKRAKRMRDYVGTMAGDYNLRLPEAAGVVDRDLWPAHVAHMQWPLPNVWLGVSCERQQEADERIHDLLATPAAVRFVSAEPLLGPIYFNKWLLCGTCNKCRQFVVGYRRHGGGIEHYDCNYLAAPLTNLGWIIVGSESGPGARPCDLDWVRSIRDQCSAAGVPFFWKQHAVNGRKQPTPELDGKKWTEFPQTTA